MLKASPKSVINSNSIQANGKCYGNKYKKLNVNNNNNKNGNINWKLNGKEDENEFRFTLCMEPKLTSGFISANIIMAFSANTIPIYSGGVSETDLFDVFNKNAFIYYDIKNPQPALEKIAEIEMNEKKYYEMMSQPILAAGALEKYFSLDNDVGNGVLKNRIRDMMGIKYDRLYGNTGK